MPTQERLWLDDQKGLLPCSYHPGQKHQEQPIRCGTDGAFHLSPENNERLSQECVFCHELGLATGLVCQCAQQERGGVRCGPGDEAVVERLKTKACQPREDGENPVHSAHSPYVKMNESMLEMVLFFS
jgi:hypothetical protein